MGVPGFQKRESVTMIIREGAVTKRSLRPFPSSRIESDEAGGDC